MTQYLLAAEADKIQDLIFRASKLREVVGGSQFLSRFEADEDVNSALQLLRTKIAPTSEIVTAGGGSFRLLFVSEPAALEFGHKLAEVYRLATGGLMSVAHPVTYDGDYRAASEKAELALRRAKVTGQHGRTVDHLPYLAFCASCGIAVANEFEAANEKYLCSVCRAKGNERRAEQIDRFLKPFYETVAPDHYKDYDWPGKTFDQDPLSELAELDARNYVAYLVADGNNMGKLFSQCNRQQAQKLSQLLSPLLRTCLAQPTRPS
jgi:CRISPR/Cas system-associated protein Cas10 (large subunit of type III CRISPR-Cas system)